MKNLASNESNESQKIVLFQEKQIRRTWHNDEWYLSVIDVVEALSDSNNPRRYWSDLKRKLLSEGFSELYEKIVQLKLVSSDGKKYLTDCANTQSLLRIVMSVPSPKAEPFKLWLAQVGKQHLDEIENPELAADRARELYRAKGYPDEWIGLSLFPEKNNLVKELLSVT